MARIGASWDNYEQANDRQARRIAKLERIQGLRDLLETHEALEEPDHPYVLELRAKLRAAQNQYDCMRI